MAFTPKTKRKKDIIGTLSSAITTLTKEIVDGAIEHKLDDNIQDFRSTGRKRMDEQGAQGVEERLEKHPKHFAARSAEKLAFQFGRDVGIVSFVSLILQKDIQN